MYRHLNDDLLPAAFRHGTMDGGPRRHPAQHQADIVRAATLYRHGGVWVDPSFFLVRSVDEICWDKLSDPEYGAEIYAIQIQGIFVINGFLAARSGSPFVKKWAELYLHLWEGRTNSAGLSGHTLMAPVLDALGQRKTSWDDSLQIVKWSVGHDVVFDYGLQMLCWQRVVMLIDRLLS